MTLLTIAQGLARNVGMQSPASVVGSTAREWQEALQFANETGEELARRVDWGALQATATLTGDGTNKVHSLPTGFSRFSNGVAIKVGGAIVRPLSRAEWNSLTAVEGTPRYFLAEGREVTLWPYLANAATATASYQSDLWTSAGGDRFTADDQTSLIDEDVFLKGLIVRWRTQKGMDVAGYEQEFEATLADYASFDDRSRF